MRDKMIYLKRALIGAGLTFIFGMYPLLIGLMGPEWRNLHQPNNELLIVGLYATLGVFLLLAARRPMQHLSLIWFTVAACMAHGVVMLLLAQRIPAERIHLVGEVPVLLVVAAILAVFTLRAKGEKGMAAVEEIDARREVVRRSMAS